MLIFILKVSIIFWVPETISKLKMKSVRTHSEKHIINNDSYEIFTKYLDKYENKSVYCPNQIYCPERNYNKNNYMDEFRFNEIADYIITNNNSLKQNILIYSNEKFKEKYMDMIVNFQEYIISENENCDKKVCYKKK